MPTLDDVNLIPRAHHRDGRGWLLKVVDGREENLPPRTGEVYLTASQPGVERGHHFHPRADEWFTVVRGEADLVLVDPASRQRSTLRLDERTPVTVFVPHGIAHVFRNVGQGELLLVAYASELFDPADTVPFDCG